MSQHVHLCTTCQNRYKQEPDPNKLTGIRCKRCGKKTVECLPYIQPAFIVLSVTASILLFPSVCKAVRELPRE